MTRLRKMMLEELQARNYSAITTRNYLRVVTEFAKYFGKSPDKLGPNTREAIRRGGWSWDLSWQLGGLVSRLPRERRLGS